MVSFELSEIADYGAFEAGVMRVLNERAPVKKKAIRANDGPFMTKAFRKEHMHRTRLRNKYHKNRTDANLKALKAHFHFNRNSQIACDPLFEIRMRSFANRMQTFAMRF